MVLVFQLKGFCNTNILEIVAHIQNMIQIVHVNAILYLNVVENGQLRRLMMMSTLINILKLMV